MDKTSPVGVFDSGAGGVSFLIEASKLLPKENYIYYGDLKNAPYGERPEREIRALTHAACMFLYEHGAKAIVMACNTATSAAVAAMREELDLPIISMEPAVKPALGVLSGGRVLTLATPATVAQPRYQELLSRLGAQDRVVSVGCPGLAGLIDGRASDELLEQNLDAALRGLYGQRFDAVVLGCTHYIFIKRQIAGFCARHFAGQARFFDGNAGTARQLARVLEARGLVNGEGGGIGFFSSGSAADTEGLERLFYDNREAILG